MNPIDAFFERLRSKKQRAFIPFVTAGDPDLKTTAALAHELADLGGGLLEVGFPYSDPIADGSVIQASYTRALNRGLRIDQVFEAVGELAKQPPFAGGAVPLFAMVSYSLVEHRGAEKFIARAQESGFSGAIIPDLPVEEAQEVADRARARDFKLIQLVTPTTPRDRALQIARTSTGFLYCVSVVGITGERSDLPPALIDQLRWLRGQTDLPLCVGFGISRPEQVQMLRDHVDGVIVASAILRRLEEIGKRPAAEVMGEIRSLVKSLVGALNG